MSRVIVVTGAASGIGEATARRLAADGERVVVIDRDEAGAQRVAASLPTDAVAIAADVSREDEVRGYMARAVEHFGAIHGYHLNAGILGSGEPFPQLTGDAFDAVLGVNLRGAFYGLREAFRQFARQGGGGAIVTTASISSLRSSPDTIAYQASKHGLIGLTRGAAMYGAPLGIRVNAVAPGLIETGMASTPAIRDEMVRRAGTVPIRRIGTADEVAAIVRFLLSDDAAYVVGEVVSVDGGASIVSSARPSGGAGLWDASSLDATLLAGMGSAIDDENLPAADRPDCAKELPLDRA